MTCKDCKYSAHRVMTPKGYLECELYKCIMPHGFMCGDLEERNENQGRRNANEYRSK